MISIKKMVFRFVKYMRDTKDTEIVPAKYAIPSAILLVLILVFFVHPKHVLSDEYVEIATSSNDEQVIHNNVDNPLVMDTLLADTHNSEEWIPQVPNLPEGITLDPNYLDVLNDPARTTPAPVRSVEIKPTTTTTTIALPEGTCSEWYPTAIEAGWSVDQLNKLGNIIWEESNCRHDVANKTYSYGLTQIEWSAHKNWLKTEFGITERDTLYDPYTNLLVAKWLYDYADQNYGCGWQPWYMSGDWC